MPKSRPTSAQFAPLPLAAEEEPTTSSCCSGVAEVVLAGASWSACSVSMTVLNKIAINKTDAPIAVLILQMVVTTLIAGASSDIRFGAGWKLWASTVPVLFVLMMVTSMLALKYVTVGTFVVARNLGPLVTLVIETTVHRPENLNCDLKTSLSLAVIGAGVWLYEANEARAPSKQADCLCSPLHESLSLLLSLSLSIASFLPGPLAIAQPPVSS